MSACKTHGALSLASARHGGQHPSPKAPPHHLQGPPTGARIEANWGSVSPVRAGARLTPHAWARTQGRAGAPRTCCSQANASHQQERFSGTESGDPGKPRAGWDSPPREGRTQEEGQKGPMARGNRATAGARLHEDPVLGDPEEAGTQGWNTALMNPVHTHARRLVHTRTQAHAHTRALYKKAKEANMDAVCAESGHMMAPYQEGALQTSPGATHPPELTRLQPSAQRPTGQAEAPGGALED